jgi:hypothetical protein
MYDDLKTLLEKKKLANQEALSEVIRMLPLGHSCDEAFFVSFIQDPDLLTELYCNYSSYGLSLFTCPIVGSRRFSRTGS